MDHLFVYGSLLSGLDRADLLAPARSRVPARTRGELWVEDGGRYPTLLEGTGWVRGELCALAEPEALLAELDRFEGVQEGLYLRTRRDVLTDAGGWVSAWIYVCPPARAALLTARGRRLVHGDWRRAAR